MRRSRGRSFAFRGKGQREQLAWFRQEFTLTNAGPFGTALAGTLFDPDTFQAGDLDERWTVRRIKCQVSVIVVVSVAGTTPQVLNAWGIALRGREEADASPTLAAAADRHADWMYLADFPIVAAAGTNVASTDSRFDTSLADVKAMRKVDNDQVIGIVIQQKGLDTADFTNPTVTRFSANVQSSVLFQRTRR